MKCPLCGLEFHESQGTATCNGCAMAKSCSLVKCPNCGYEVPREPQLFITVRNWLQRWRSAEHVAH